MADSLFDLSGKFAFITGATKGIGRAIAEAYVDYGAIVAVTGRRAANAEAAAAEINERVGREAAIGLAAEMCDRATLFTAYDAAVARFGRIDVLVCNAAVLQEEFGAAAILPIEEYSRLMEGNIVNNAALMMHAAEAMKERRDGILLATSSTGGVWPSFGHTPYSVSKAGLNFWIRSYAAEIAPYNVRVNAVAPGLTRSWSMQQKEQTDPDAIKMFEQRTPLRRITEPREIAAVMVMLASAAGQAMTGQVIAVSGEPCYGADPSA